VNGFEVLYVYEVLYVSEGHVEKEGREWKEGNRALWKEETEPTSTCAHGRCQSLLSISTALLRTERT